LFRIGHTALQTHSQLRNDIAGVDKGALDIDVMRASRTIEQCEARVCRLIG
jgi:hypothetical protein